jgi:hypothetical protein
MVTKSGSKIVVEMASILCRIPDDCIQDTEAKLMYRTLKEYLEFPGRKW